MLESPSHTKFVTVKSSHFCVTGSHVVKVTGSHRVNSASVFVPFGCFMQVKSWATGACRPAAPAKPASKLPETYDISSLYCVPQMAHSAIDTAMKTSGTAISSSRSTLRLHSCRDDRSTTANS
ncbi:hypothetical protein NESM_000920900 [Novymonas esmeraldas]|uniref:Uncharacterized protein n=1 Tax=Novymonas esmeraldas TaxID=1808958 RepID=A0AAW0EZX8_9TRYP